MHQLHYYGMNVALSINRYQAHMCALFQSESCDVRTHVRYVLFVPLGTSSVVAGLPPGRRLPDKGTSGDLVRIHAYMLADIVVAIPAVVEAVV